MYEVTRKVTCDKCGKPITHHKEWNLSLHYWGGETSTYKAWEAELCEDCNKALLDTLAKFDLTIRYSEE